MDHFKMSTARDFRIIAQNLQQALDKQEGSSDEGEGGEAGEDDTRDEGSTLQQVTHRETSGVAKSQSCLSVTFAF